MITYKSEVGDEYLLYTTPKIIVTEKSVPSPGIFNLNLKTIHTENATSFKTDKLPVNVNVALHAYLLSINELLQSRKDEYGVTELETRWLNALHFCYYHARG